MQPPDRNEILNRLKLIEDMMAEGRRTSQRWGWTLLLWGAGPLLAMLWAARWPHPEWAWPVVIGVGVIVNGLIIRLRESRGHRETAAMRSVGAVWACVGLAALLLAFGAVWAAVADLRLLYAALFVLAAVAHNASSLILKWRPQFLAALVWWLSAAAAFAVPADRLEYLAALALLLGNVVFGGWLTYREWRRQDA